MRKKRSSGRIKKRKLILISAGVAVVVLLLVLLLPSSAEKAAMDSVEASIVKKRGSLVIGIRDNNPPFSTDGDGFEREIAKRIAFKLFDSTSESVYSFVNVESSLVDIYIGDGSVDIAIMAQPKGLYPKKYAYSSAYYSEPCYILTPIGNARMSLNGKTVGAITDSACKSIVSAHLDAHPELGFEVENYITYELMLNALKNGKIDACVLTRSEFEQYNSAYPMSIHSEQLGEVEYAVVSSLNSPGLAQIATAVIDELKSSGELTAIISKYGGN